MYDEPFGDSGRLHFVIANEIYIHLSHSRHKVLWVNILFLIFLVLQIEPLY